jgi:hypothetical protein
MGLLDVAYLRYAEQDVSGINPAAATAASSMMIPLIRAWSIERACAYLVAAGFPEFAAAAATASDLPVLAVRILSVRGDVAGSDGNDDGNDGGQRIAARPPRPERGPALMRAFRALLSASLEREDLSEARTLLLSHEALYPTETSPWLRVPRDPLPLSEALGFYLRAIRRALRRMPADVPDGFELDPSRTFAAHPGHPFVGSPAPASRNASSPPSSPIAKRAWTLGRGWQLRSAELERPAVVPLPTLAAGHAQPVMAERSSAGHAGDEDAWTAAEETRARALLDSLFALCAGLLANLVTDLTSRAATGSSADTRHASGRGGSADVEEGEIPGNHVDDGGNNDNGINNATGGSDDAAAASLSSAMRLLLRYRWYVHARDALAVERVRHTSVTGARHGDGGIPDLGSRGTMQLPSLSRGARTPFVAGPFPRPVRYAGVRPGSPASKLVGAVAEVSTADLETPLIGDAPRRHAIPPSDPMHHHVAACEWAARVVQFRDLVPPARAQGLLVAMLGVLAYAGRGGDGAKERFGDGGLGFFFGLLCFLFFFVLFCFAL